MILVNATNCADDVPRSQNCFRSTSQTAISGSGGAYDCVIAPQTPGANVDPLIKPRYARELLVPVYSWFTDGFDTLDLK